MSSPIGRASSTISKIKRSVRTSDSDKSAVAQTKNSSTKLETVNATGLKTPSSPRNGSLLSRTHTYRGNNTKVGASPSRASYSATDGAEHKVEKVPRPSARRGISTQRDTSFRSQSSVSSNASRSSSSKSPSSSSSSSRLATSRSSVSSNSSSASVSSRYLAISKPSATPSYSCVSSRYLANPKPAASSNASPYVGSRYLANPKPAASSNASPYAHVGSRYLANPSDYANKSATGGSVVLKSILKPTKGNKQIDNKAQPEKVTLVSKKEKSKTLGGIDIHSVSLRPLPKDSSFEYIISQNQKASESRRIRFNENVTIAKGLYYRQERIDVFSDDITEAKGYTSIAMNLLEQYKVLVRNGYEEEATKRVKKAKRGAEIAIKLAKEAQDLSRTSSERQLAKGIKENAIKVQKQIENVLEMQNKKQAMSSKLRADVLQKR